MNYMEERILNELIVLTLEGKASDDQKESLYSMLSESPGAIEHYIEYISIVSSLLKADARILSSFKHDIISQDDQSCLDEAETSGFRAGGDSNTSIRGVDLSGLNLDVDPEESEGSGLSKEILELLELERTSSAVEIEKPAPEEPKRELIQKVERDFKWFPGRPSKFKLRLLAAMAACIMVFAGYLYFFASNSVAHPVVAKLGDSIEAVWDSELELPDEFGDMIQSRYGLKKGCASIMFIDGARVAVEAPAEFSLNSSGDMELFKGKIYATVPDRAKGFSVKAVSSKVVDLGTEFGVEVDNAGNAQLHVIKGKTVLFTDLFNGRSSSENVDEGAAKKVYNDGLVMDIKLEERKFARKISSKYNLVFRGQKFNSADLVGQLGKLDTSWINPATGNLWAVGDQYRLAFVTSEGTRGIETGISYYNSFVQSVADAAGLGSAAWNIIGSTADVDARDNTGTNPTVETGLPVFLIDGTTLIADDNDDLWGGSLYASIKLDEKGTAMSSNLAWTGTSPDGTKSTGRYLGISGQVSIGSTNDLKGTRWISNGTRGAHLTSTVFPVYAISEPLTVVSKSATTNSVHTTR